LEAGVLFLEIDKLGWDIAAIEELFGIGWLDVQVEFSEEDWGLRWSFWDGLLVWGGAKEDE
jgi:hypothetical protein